MKDHTWLRLSTCFCPDWGLGFVLIPVFHGRGTVLWLPCSGFSGFHALGWCLASLLAWAPLSPHGRVSSGPTSHNLPIPVRVLGGRDFEAGPCRWCFRMCHGEGLKPKTNSEPSGGLEGSTLGAPRRGANLKFVHPCWAHFQESENIRKPSQRPLDRSFSSEVELKKYRTWSYTFLMPLPLPLYLSLAGGLPKAKRQVHNRSWLVNISITLKHISIMAQHLFQWLATCTADLLPLVIRISFGLLYPRRTVMLHT